MRLAAACTLAFAASLSFHAAEAATLNFQLDTGGGDGTVVDPFLPSPGFEYSFLLVGSDTGSMNPVVTQYTATAGPVDLIVSGIFDYLSADVEGPFFDPFGFVNDGEFTQLSDNDIPFFQNGSFSFLVAAGTSFGWYVDSFDDDFGPAFANVSANVAPVPLPAAGWLLLGALGLMGVLRRRGRPTA